MIDKSLAAARCSAHAAFDPKWQRGSMSRSQAYAWLARKLGIPRERCHMEYMSIKQCHRVVDICTADDFNDRFTTVPNGSPANEEKE